MECDTRKSLFFVLFSSPRETKFNFFFNSNFNFFQTHTCEERGKREREKRLYNQRQLTEKKESKEEHGAVYPKKNY